MANVILTQASSGAPTLSGTNGTLCAVLDWALVQNGWTIEYTATNNRVYRPGSGKRFRLFVCHDSTVSGAATLATTRGCESASAASTAGIVDPFPTVAQLTNAQSSVCVSQTASATARNYLIVVGVDFITMAISTNALNQANWELFSFGDWGTDVWATGILVAGQSSISSAFRAMSNNISTVSATAAPGVYWCRNIDGSQKSGRGHLYSGMGNSGATSFCNVVSQPVMRGGYANRIVREKVAVSDIGANTGSFGPLMQLKRGWLPFVWNPIHTGIGTVTSDDTFTDTAYNPSASFQIVPASSTIAAILETTDTWTVPSG